MKRLTLFLIITTLISMPLLSHAASADAELELRLQCPEDQTCPDPEKEEFTIDVVLKNPSQQNITSVQSWLNYDASKLEGVKIEVTNAFDLVAPGEKNFDAENSRIKLGLASTSGGVNQAEIVLASITLKTITKDKGLTDINFYDYQVSELGHTNANIIEDNFPVNILAKSPNSLEIPLNGIPPQKVAVGGPPKTEEPQIIPLERPQNLTLSSGHQYAQLQWSPVTDSRAVGYYVYYGTKTGFYLHRKNVGNVNTFYVTDLQNDVRYYFAIIAYDIQGNESDYSQEETVIINHSDTSTSPMASIPQDLERTETGPTSLLIILTALIAGTTGIIFTMPKRRSLRALRKY